MATYGIDFGTTNTRVAFFDGRSLNMVPVKHGEGESSVNIPSVVAYSDGQPLSFGYDALRTHDCFRLTSLKWCAERSEPVDIGGGVSRMQIF